MTDVRPGSQQAAPSTGGRPEMRIRSESALTFLGIAINAGLAFLVTWMIAHGLGAAATGGFFLLTSLFMILTSAIGLGADTGLVRSLSRSRALDEKASMGPSVRTAVLPVAASGSVVSAGLWIGASAIAEQLGLGADGVPTIRVLALVLLPAALTGILLGGSRGLGRISTYTVVQNLFIPISRVLAVGTAVYLLGSASAVIWAWALPLAVAAALAAVALRRQLRRAADGAPAPLDRAERRALRRRFWGFSLPRGGTVVLERALDWADVLLVIWLLGPVVGGVYGVVTRIVQAGSMLEAALRIVMGPRLSGAMAVGQQDRAERIFQQVTQLLILASWPFYLVIAVFAEDILALFGDEFVAGAPALIISAAAMALKNTAGALQTVLLMVGRSTWQLRNKAIQLLVLAVLTLLLAPQWGITGAALAFACSVVVDTALAMHQVYRRLGFTSNGRSVLVASLPPLVVVLGGGLVLSLLLRDAGAAARFISISAIVPAYAIVVQWAAKKGVFLDGRDSSE